MEWSDDAVVLSARRQGEASALVMLLTGEHGRHAGLVRGGQNRRRRGVLEPGTLVRARWRARLPDQLGTLALEPTRSLGAALFDLPDRLAALVSACALLEVGLSEREPHPALYQAVLALFEALEQPAWAEAYVRWEVGLLGELGFGLDLSARAPAAPYRERWRPLGPTACWSCPDFSAARAAARPTSRPGWL